ncbi:NAC domain containing protein 82 [Theobroma cacao]|uniref:NAC domain containing protein 82 n=1 Tax=Theobroma cacao TaxID=3641 RepID=A0A061GAC1_THECC|nr:NAC domain containing protein 82 [Theobroma cacao]
MFCSMEKNSLPPGFRFHPTDVELLQYYLRRKVLGKKFSFEAIAEVDIYKYAPWDLPHKSLLRTGDLKWYFFCPMEKKYGKGSKFNRATTYGYWETTRKDRPVRYNDKVVGSIKLWSSIEGKPHEEREQIRFCTNTDLTRELYRRLPFFVLSSARMVQAIETVPNMEHHLERRIRSQCLGSPAESSHFAASPSVVLDANKSLTPMEASQVLVDDSVSAMLSSGQSEDYSPVAITNDDLEFLESPDIVVDDEIMSLLATCRADDTLNSLMF